MRRVCVFCGSRPGARADYIAAAEQLAHTLAARGIGLVYGGASIGVMGALADAMLANGGEAIGVMPSGLFAKEIAHQGLTDLRVVRSMHERKALMADLSDGFIALPGGLGTFEELFEAWSWNYLGIQTKPCGLLDSHGYYHRLLEFLDHTADQGFVSQEQLAILLVDDNPQTLLDKFMAYRPPAIRKWLGYEEI